MTEKTIKCFSAELIEDLRERVAEISRVPEDCPEGWSISSIDPARVLAVFESLSLKTGFMLRAYQYRSGGNGNGLVWALPEGKQLPDPRLRSRLSCLFLSPGKPPAALPNFMEAIDGDGTPFSYLSASIAGRELVEFGAMWHGISWGSVSMLGGDPWSNPQHIPKRQFHKISNDGWVWKTAKPERWEPSIEFKGNSAIVTFITYSGLGQETISRVTDRFSVGSYVSENKTATLATGPSGFRF